MIKSYFKSLISILIGVVASCAPAPIGSADRSHRLLGAGNSTNSGNAGSAGTAGSSSSTNSDPASSDSPSPTPTISPSGSPTSSPSGSPTSTPKASPKPSIPPVVPFNQVVGTQVIGPSYHFTNKDPVLEGAQAVRDMGSRMIKLAISSDEPELSQVAFEKILNMDFTTYFFWYRSTATLWSGGLSKKDSNTEYTEVYNFAVGLLKTYASTGKTFFIGHWEGDWYLIDDPSQNPSAAAIQGMIDWLNIRQKAVDDARVAVPHSTAKIYNYTEVNQVRDAMNKGSARLVNSVLPYVNVDYVSYSSYDVQNESQDTVNQTLDFINSKIKKKASIKGKRVFIGEYGIPGKYVNFDENKHRDANVQILMKYLNWGVPYALYWEMYNNEVESSGLQVGYWLIDNNNHKTPLYYSFKNLYGAQDKQYGVGNGVSADDVADFSANYLNTH